MVARPYTGRYQETDRYRGCNSKRALKASEARHTFHPRKTHRTRMHTRAKKQQDQPCLCHNCGSQWSVIHRPDRAISKGEQ
eukprot:198937-Ditylum_brightwellii.AAC.1